MPDSPAQVADDDLLTTVAAVLTRAGVPGQIDVDTNLWEFGMDSLVSVSVMVGVETTYDIEFPDELLTRERFSTVANIATAVRLTVAGGLA